GSFGSRVQPLKITGPGGSTAPPSSPAELGWRVRVSAVYGPSPVRVGRALVRSLGGGEAGEMRAEGWRTRQRPPPDSSPAASPPRAPGARPRPRSLPPPLSPQCASTTARPPPFPAHPLLVPSIRYSATGSICTVTWLMS